jgi:hypothetical protein
MATFKEAVSEAIKAGYCGTVRREPAYFAALRRLVVNPDSGLADAANTFNKLVCNSSDDAEDDFPPPPFTGGQCSVLYTVNVAGTNTCLGGGSGSGFVTGPISGGFAAPRGTGTACDGSPSWSFFVQGAPSTSPVQIGPVNMKQADANTWGITSVSRLDAGPDNCGDPPIEFPPVGPINVGPFNITYNDDGDTEITVPIALVFAPVTISANGTVSIPVTIDVGGIEFSANFDLFPDAEITFFPNGLFGSPGTPDNPEITDPEPGSEGQEEPEDEPILDAMIIGVVVRSVKDGLTRSSEVDQDALPTLYAPRLGNVSFRVRSGSITSWTPAQPIQFADQHLPCPWPYGAVDVAVWWDAGWSGQFTPVRGRPLGTLS